jgi:hypothetical protein
MNGTGWTTSRHYSVPTTDLPVQQIYSNGSDVGGNISKQYEVLEWFHNRVMAIMTPILSEQFRGAIYYISIYI